MLAGTQVEVCRAVFDFIEGWNNRRRRHSALDYLSPTIYEGTSGIGDRTVTSRSTIDQGGAISDPPRRSPGTISDALMRPLNRQFTSRRSTRAFRSLEAPVPLAKRKHGFAVPTNLWLRSDPGFRAQAGDILQSPSCRGAATSGPAPRRT